MTSLRFLRNLACFVLGLGFASSLLYAWGPHERPLVERAVGQRSKCQVLLVGPSYVNSGIKSGVFEEETRRLGMNLRACKLSATALIGFELEHALALALEKPWPKLEHVIIDITLGDGLVFERENWFKPRLVEWHTWGALPFLLREYGRPGRGWLRKAPELTAHLEHFAMNYLGVGRGAAALERVELLERLRATPPKEEREDTRESRPRVDRRYAATLARLKREKRLAREQTAPDAWARELRDLVRARGQDPIFLYSPVLKTMRPLASKNDKDPYLLFDFEDPERYPELYDIGVRARGGHVSTEGALIYSRLLAQALDDLRKRKVVSGSRRRR